MLSLNRIKHIFISLNIHYSSQNNRPNKYKTILTLKKFRGGSYLLSTTLRNKKKNQILKNI